MLQVERPDHLEAWVEALELGNLQPQTARQVTFLSSFAAGGCWKDFERGWTGRSAVGTPSLLKSTHRPRFYPLKQLTTPKWQKSIEIKPNLPQKRAGAGKSDSYNPQFF